MITKLKIKNVTTKNNIFLAPMAGYTDVGFRHMCKKYGAGLTTTEMVSVKALTYGSEKTMELLYTSSLEDVKCVQLFGHTPEDFVSVIKSGVVDKFDIIDINMGCPAPKIYSNGDGSALLSNLPLASEIIKACVNSTNKPITVKFRSGIDEDHLVGVEFARMCEKSGASLITIHPRTRVQGYSGHSDWELVKQITKAVKIPVVVSGDIKTIEDVNYLTNECGASGVMIGRNALGKPEIFAELLNNTKMSMTLSEKLDQIKEHIHELEKYYDEKYIYLNMKKHILAYLAGFNNATKLKEEIVRAESLAETIDLIEKAIKNSGQN